MITHNKLVRDKIIDIIKSDNKDCSYEILDNKRYKEELIKKLHEEVNEFVESEEIEEIADILEVIESILTLKNSSFEEVFNIKAEKTSKRGGFKNRLYLKDVF